MTHHCGGCTLCCEIVPVKELGLAAYTRCAKLRSPLAAKGPGCSIYAERPFSCRAWSCGWLTSPDLPAELRPDKSGVIVDNVVDLIQVNGQEQRAAQIWVAPGHEEDYRSNELVWNLILALIDEIGAVIWRMPNKLAIVILEMPDGSIALGPPTEATPENVPNSLGSAAERFLRAMLIEGKRA